MNSQINDEMVRGKKLTHLESSIKENESKKKIIENELSILKNKIIDTTDKKDFVIKREEKEKILRIEDLEKKILKIDKENHEHKNSISRYISDLLKIEGFSLELNVLNLQREPNLQECIGILEKMKGFKTVDEKKMPWYKEGGRIIWSGIHRLGKLLASTIIEKIVWLIIVVILTYFGWKSLQGVLEYLIKL